MLEINNLIFSRYFYGIISNPEADKIIQTLKHAEIFKNLTINECMEMY